jgi:hypothetical protein
MTDCADVEFLIAAVAEKAGTFVDWEGVPMFGVAPRVLEVGTGAVPAGTPAPRLPNAVFGFVIVLILGLARVWDSAGRQRTQVASA